jgi:hypothetical protein
MLYNIINKYCVFFFFSRSIKKKKNQENKESIKKERTKDE